MKKYLSLLLTCAVATTAHALTFSSETFNYETVSSNEVKITGLTTKGKTLTSIMIYAGTTYDGTYYRITEIADGAFKNNDAFTTCNMTPASYLTRIGDEAFMNTRVSTVATPAKVIGTRAFYGSRLSSIDLQDGVQEIGSYAFSECSNLKTLSIPASVTSIAHTTFVDKCIYLTEIVVDTKNTKYASYLGMLYNKSFSTLYICPAAYDGINLYQTSFKPSVTGLGNGAFKDNRTIKSIHLPYGVLTVGNEAFAGSVVEGVWMPSTMLSFGKDVFSNCGSLKDVGINASTLPYFNDDMMRNAPAKATLHVPYSAINKYNGTGKFSGWTVTNGSYDIGTDINSNSSIRKPHSGYTVVSTKAETIDGVQYQGRVRYDSWYPKWGSTELKIAESVTFNNKKYIVFIYVREKTQILYLHFPIYHKGESHMTIAALNCRMLTLTSYKADIEFRLQRIMEKRQYLSYKSIGIASQKSTAMQNEDEYAQYILEQQENQINALDKIFEMDQTNIETQQKAASTELESIQKLLDNNIKKEFKYDA